MEELVKEVMEAPGEGNIGLKFFTVLVMAFVWEKTPKGAEHARQIAEENAKRLSAIGEHMSHQLLRLAETAIVELDDGLRAYLDALSDLHQIGRYPAHSKKDVGDLSAFVGNKDLRDRLGKVLEDRFNEVIDSMPPPDMQEVLQTLGMSQEGFAAPWAEMALRVAPDAQYESFLDSD